MPRTERSGLPEHDERWDVTLIVLLSAYLIGSLPVAGIARPGLVVLLVTVLLLITRVDHLDRRLKLLNLMALVGIVLFGLIELATDSDTVRGLQAIALCAAFASAGVAILSRLARHTVVTLQTVCGALDIYVLISFTFATAYAAIGDLSGTFFAQPTSGQLRDFFYFSTVTITTVGFGDLTPLSPLARSLTALEALVGQIFLVTAVARIVSMIGHARPPRKERDG